MKYLTMFSLLFLMACGSSQPESGAAATSSDVPAPVVSAPTTIPVASLHDPQFVVACPNNVLGFPEVLLFSGGHFLLVTSTGGGVSYSSRAVGNYTTADGRNCNYDVNADGSLTSN